MGNFTSSQKKSKIMFLIAEKKRQKKQYEQAVIYYTKAIELQPYKPNYHNSKGVCLLQLEKYKDAEKAFDEAIKLAPKNAVYLNNKGMCLSKLGDAHRAVQYYNSSLISSTRPLRRITHSERLQENEKVKYKQHRPWITYKNKGIIFANERNYKEAIECYDKSIRLKPFIAINYILKGEVLYQLGLFLEAVCCFNTAIFIYNFLLSIYSYDDKPFLSTFFSSLPSSTLLLENSLLSLISPFFDENPQHLKIHKKKDQHDNNDNNNIDISSNQNAEQYYNKKNKKEVLNEVEYKYLKQLLEENNITFVDYAIPFNRLAICKYALYEYQESLSLCIKAIDILSDQSELKSKLQSKIKLYQEMNDMRDSVYDIESVNNHYYYFFVDISNNKKRMEEMTLSYYWKARNYSKLLLYPLALSSFSSLFYVLIHKDDKKKLNIDPDDIKNINLEIVNERIKEIMTYPSDYFDENLHRVISDAIYTIGMMYIDSNEDREAYRYIEKSLSYFPQKISYLMAKLKVLVNLQMNLAAMDICNQVIFLIQRHLSIKQQQKNINQPLRLHPAIHLDLGSSSREKRDISSINNADSNIRKNITDVYKEKAQLLCELGQYNEAIDCCNLALSMITYHHNDPNYHHQNYDEYDHLLVEDFYYIKAECYSRNGLYSNAVDCCNRITDLLNPISIEHCDPSYTILYNLPKSTSSTITLPVLNEQSPIPFTSNFTFRSTTHIPAPPPLPNASVSPLIFEKSQTPQQPQSESKVTPPPVIPKPSLVIPTPLSKVEPKQPSEPSEPSINWLEKIQREQSEAERNATKVIATYRKGDVILPLFAPPLVPSPNYRQHNNENIIDDSDFHDHDFDSDGNPFHPIPPPPDHHPPLPPSDHVDISNIINNINSIHDENSSSVIQPEKTSSIPHPISLSAGATYIGNAFAGISDYLTSTSPLPADLIRSSFSTNFLSKTLTLPPNNNNNNDNNINTTENESPKVDDADRKEEKNEAPEEDEDEGISKLNEINDLIPEHLRKSSPLSRSVSPINSPRQLDSSNLDDNISSMNSMSDIDNSVIAENNSSALYDNSIHSEEDRLISTSMEDFPLDENHQFYQANEYNNYNLNNYRNNIIINTPSPYIPALSTSPLSTASPSPISTDSPLNFNVEIINYQVESDHSSNAQNNNSEIGKNIKPQDDKKKKDEEEKEKKKRKVKKGRKNEKVSLVDEKRIENRFLELELSFNKVIEYSIDSHSLSKAYNSKGFLYESMGIYPKALKYYQIASKICPNEPNFWSNQGNIYRKLNQFSQSLSCYLHSISIDKSKTNLIAHYGISITYYYLKEYSSSLHHLNLFLNAIELFSLSIESSKSLHSHEPKRTTSASPFSTTFASFSKSRLPRLEAPKYPETTPLLSEPPPFFDEDDDHYHDAHAYHKTNDIPSNENIVEDGEELVRIDELDKSINEINEAFNESNNRKNKHKKSVIQIEKENSNNDYNIQVILQRKKNFKQLGKKKERRAMIKEIEKGLHRVYYRLGETLTHLGKYEDALVYYQKAIILSPYSALYRNNQGILFQRYFQQYESSIDCFEIAINLAPDQPIHYHNKAVSHMKLGEYLIANRLINKAIELNRYNDRYYASKGLLFLYIAKFQIAIKCYRRAIDLKSKPSYYYQLSYCYRKLGLYPQAIHFALLSIETLQASLDKKNNQSNRNKENNNNDNDHIVDYVNNEDEIRRIDDEDDEDDIDYYYYNLGFIYQLDGQYQNAINYYILAIQALSSPLPSSPLSLSSLLAQTLRENSPIYNPNVDSDINHNIGDNNFAFSQSSKEYNDQNEVEKKGKMGEKKNRKANYYHRIGVCFQNQNDHLNALNYFQFAIDLQSSVPSFFASKAKSFCLIYLYDLSLSCYSTSIYLFSNFLSSLKQSAEQLKNRRTSHFLYSKFLQKIERKQLEFEQLKAQKEKIILIKEGLPLEFADIFLNISQCDHYIELYPSHPVAYHCKSLFLMLTQNYKEALRYSDIAISINPNIALFYVVKCKSYESLYDPDRAIEALDWAIHLLERSGDYADAIQTLQYKSTLCYRFHFDVPYYQSVELMTQLTEVVKNSSNLNLLRTQTLPSQHYLLQHLHYLLFNPPLLTYRKPFLTNSEMSQLHYNN